MVTVRLSKAIAVCSLLALVSAHTEAQACADGDADSDPHAAVGEPAVPSCMLQKGVQRAPMHEQPDAAEELEEDAEAAAEEEPELATDAAELETDSEEFETARAPKVTCPNPVELNPPEEKRTYFSVENDDPAGQGNAQSMLNSPNAWSSASDTKFAWMEMDLEKKEWLVGIIAQGQKGGSEWVTKYRVWYSPDKKIWREIDGMRGDQDADTKVPVRLSVPELARYVRIGAESWHKHISMRAGVLVCREPTE